MLEIKENMSTTFKPPVSNSAVSHSDSHQAPGCHWRVLQVRHVTEELPVIPSSHHTVLRTAARRRHDAQENLQTVLISLFSWCLFCPQTKVRTTPVAHKLTKRSVICGKVRYLLMSDSCLHVHGLNIQSTPRFDPTLLIKLFWAWMCLTTHQNRREAHAQAESEEATRWMCGFSSSSSSCWRAQSGDVTFYTFCDDRTHLHLGENSRGRHHGSGKGVPSS